MISTPQTNETHVKEMELQPRIINLIVLHSTKWYTLKYYKNSPADAENTGSFCNFAKLNSIQNGILYNQR